VTVRARKVPFAHCRGIPLPWSVVPSPLPEPPAPGALGAGYRIGGRYELARRIARGGMAEVWEAEDTVLARPVAIKVLLPHLAADQSFLARFRREAVAAARLSHPHIVSIYDTCAGEDCEAIVMELVRGRTVREVLDDRGALPVRQAVEIAVQVADALAHAHANGLVHRDVKPGNILLSEDGRVLVADFGIAKALEGASDLTEVGQVVGTAKYLSPEQVQGHAVDDRSDVYSLGVVLYEMLCGRPPFSGANATAIAMALLTTEPLRPRQIRAGVPRALEDIVLHAMARSPEQRYPSAVALRSALAKVDVSRIDDHDHTAIIEAAHPIPHPGEEMGFARRERAWLVPAALILVVAVTLGVVGVVVGRSDVGHQLFGTNTPAKGPSEQPITLRPARSFDPAGDRVEDDADLHNLEDGNPSTRWHTDTYTTAAFGGLKKGVGVIIPVAPGTALGTLTVDSPTSGWKASIYLANGEPTTLEGWGQPVGTLAEHGKVALGGRKAGAVLIWIIDLGPAHRVDIGEVHLTG
jgi:hypothetical protein